VVLACPGLLWADRSEFQSEGALACAEGHVPQHPLEKQPVMLSLICMTSADLRCSPKQIVHVVATFGFRGARV
jgi:hypothetical protein